MKKRAISSDEVMDLIREGWRFREKTVKGRRYITARRGQSERSLGPYSEELSNLIIKLRDDGLGRAVEGAESQPVKPSGLKGDGRPDYFLLVDRIDKRLRSFWGIHKARTCMFNGGDGYCTYWHWSGPPPFFEDLKTLNGDEVYVWTGSEGGGRGRWVIKATGFTCRGCPAFVDERMVELIRSAPAKIS